MPATGAGSVTLLLTDRHEQDSMALQRTHVDDRTGSRPTGRPGRWVWVALGAVLLAGCATVPSNTPDDYGQVTEENFASACEESGESESDCLCFYEGIVRDVPFEEFKDLEKQVEDDPTDVPTAYNEIVTTCVAGQTVGATAGPGAGDSTTTTAARS